MPQILIYFFASLMYIMIIHFAIAIKGQFNLFLMIGIFITGGILGYFINSLETGFILAVVASFIFW